MQLDYKLLFQQLFRTPCNGWAYPNMPRSCCNKGSITFFQFHWWMSNAAVITPRGCWFFINRVSSDGSVAISAKFALSLSWQRYKFWWINEYTLEPNPPRRAVTNLIFALFGLGCQHQHQKRFLLNPLRDEKAKYVSKKSFFGHVLNRLAPSRKNVTQTDFWWKDCCRSLESIDDQIRLWPFSTSWKLTSLDSWHQYDVWLLHLRFLHKAVDQSRSA